MRNKHISIEVVLAILLIALLIIFTDPFAPYMEKMVKGTGGMYTPSFVLLILYLLFITYIWKEKPRDERETHHSLTAGRFAYSIGVGVAVIGIITQTFHHTVDPWLIYVTASMVLAKLTSRIYYELKH